MSRKLIGNTCSFLYNTLIKRRCSQTLHQYKMVPHLRRNFTTTTHVFPIRLKNSQISLFGHDISLCHQPKHLSSSDASTSTAASNGGVQGENKIKSILTKAFPSATNVTVNDISGGCGSMYQVFIEATDFEGLSIVKQHQLVNKALADEIKEMHGIRITTQVPKKI